MDAGACPALVLNASYVPVCYHPLSILGWQDVVRLVYTDKVDVVASYDETVRSPSMEIQLPSVIALRDYVDITKMKVSFNRFNVYLRDLFTCQYCGCEFSSHELTYDHVIPRSKGGKTDWNNIVAACTPCNARKKNSLPSEIGMHPLNQPEKPNPHKLHAAGKKFKPKYLHDSWLEFLDYEAEDDKVAV